MGGDYLTDDDVIKWTHFLRYWPFVREIHRVAVNFPHNGDSLVSCMLRNAIHWNLIEITAVLIQENAFACRLQNGGH